MKLYEPTTQDVDDYIAAHKKDFSFLKPGKDRNASQAVRHNMRVRRIVRLILIDERGYYHD